MASLITHAVVGEHVYEQLDQLEIGDFGAFLLGCIVVDAHFCSGVDRLTTHFGQSLSEDGIDRFSRSSANFLGQLDSLLVQPWEKLNSEEKGFVAGYLCHLAADESWKHFDWETMHRLGIRWWIDLEVPASVVLTAFDVVSSGLYHDRPSVAEALRDIAVPDVLRHVPCCVFQRMWDMVKVYVDRMTTDSKLTMLAQVGEVRCGDRGSTP